MAGARGRLPAAETRPRPGRPHPGQPPVSQGDALSLQWKGGFPEKKEHYKFLVSKSKKLNSVFGKKIRVVSM